MKIASTYIAPDGNIVVNHRNATNNDIINVLQGAIPRAVKQSREVAKHFLGSTDLETARNIYNFLIKEIEYIRDSDLYQDIKLPSRFTAEATGDCKSYTLFTVSILANLGIDHSIRYTSYNWIDPTPSHVYVVLADGTIIDAVYRKFNQEKKYTHKKDMQVRTLSGINGTAPSKRSNTIGGISFDRLRQKKNTLTLAPVRAAFLALVRFNVLALATLLDLKNNTSLTSSQRSTAAVKYDEIALKFYEYGGNRTTLKEIVQEGAKRKAVGTNIVALKNLNFVKQLKSKGIISGVVRVSGINGDLAAATKLLIAIGGALTALAAILSQFTGKDKGDGTTGGDTSTGGDSSTGNDDLKDYMKDPNSGSGNNGGSTGDDEENNTTMLAAGGLLLAKFAGLF